MQTPGVKEDIFNSELFGRLFDYWTNVPEVDSHCKGCSWTYFYGLFKILSDPEILLHEDFVEKCVSLYNTLQQSFLKYKENTKKKHFYFRIFFRLL